MNRSNKTKMRTSDLLPSKGKLYQEIEKNWSVEAKKENLAYLSLP